MIKKTSAKIVRRKVSLPRKACERLPSSERAYREIKRRILDDEMAAGTAVLEEELSTLLGMSRTPVREAIIRLANEGMVEIRPRHGMRILPISADDMQDIYDILTALESKAAELLARRGLGEKDIVALRKTVKEMESALARDDLNAWAAADEKFHTLLIENTPNARLRALVYQFWDQVHRARLSTLHLRPKPVDSNKDHLALVDAIEARNAKRAFEIHQAHRVKNGAVLVELIRKNGLRLL
jgi:DNA-binding GntR family transcriptional regulator